MLNREHFDLQQQIYQLQMIYRGVGSYVGWKNSSVAQTPIKHIIGDFKIEIAANKNATFFSA